jgi:hypothetical protein
MRTRQGIGRIIVLTVSTIFIMREAYLYGAIHNPSLLRYLPKENVRRLRHFYGDHVKSVIQYIPGCGRYDKELSYTLNPGNFILEDAEFKTAYIVNSLGVRDGEEALRHPEVVVLGDSHAMGNGVSQDAAFPQVLKRSSNLSVLNTGVSSYGTVREMHMLRRIDTSRMRHLVIQYCDNDILENRAFLENGNSLPIMSQASYERISRLESKKKWYFPGKYTMYALYDYLKRKIGRLFVRRGPERPALNAEDEARLFLNALMNSGAEFSGADIIVIRTLSRDDSRKSDFAARLKEEIAGHDYPQPIKKMRIIDSADFLSAEDFFMLDDHMKPSGHKKVAEALLKAVRST